MQQFSILHRIRVILVSLALLVVTITVRAEDRRPRDAERDSTISDQAAGQQDLLLLGPLEPIRLRLIIEIDSVPFRTVWRTMFDRVADQFDTDHDGRLTADQARQISAMFMQNASSVAAGTRLEIADAMNDGSIAREQLRQQLERVTPPLTLRPRQSSGGAGPALIPLLDVDGDGRLSREELNYAEHSLHCRDFNDDQLIIKQELLAGPALSSTGTADESGVSSGSVILLSTAVNSVAVADILLARYDRNRDGELSMVAPAEILSAEGRLDVLDLNRNRSLDRDELQRFLELPLDASLPINFGNNRGDQKRTAEALPQYRLRKRTVDGGYRLHFGASEIKLSRSNRDPAQDNSRPRMQDYDADTSKVLDETEFNGIPDRPEFAVVDSDRDGKISESEFDAWFLQRSRAASVQLVLEVSDQGADLFTSLDLNGDQVLTPRELHLAAKLLETEDRDGDGFLGGVEMSYSLSLDLSRGGPRTVNNTTVAAMRVITEPQVKADRSGPAWFTKMDRNRDGDVSFSEFLGNRTIFTKLDQDGDGLISLSEAMAATTSSAAP